MEKREYEASYQLESSYWWFRGQREILIDTLSRSISNSLVNILDAGCGTGKNLDTISSRLSSRAVGFDISEWALPFLRKRGLSDNVCQASINEIPFPDDHFEAIVSLGVLECEEVEEEKAYAELWRVTKTGGNIILVVSAYQWLLAPHDRPIHAVRRYNRKSLLALLNTMPVDVVRVTHLYPTLFPFIAASRLYNRWTYSGPRMPKESDLRPLPILLNLILYQIVNIERYLLRVMDFPFGSSLLAHVQKR
jgi:ubiquinone/menaquinone biosynthesis C-methylase UbiE